jgi:hypothetical protein
MAEAQITLKLNPAEFDLIRSVLDEAKQAALAANKNADNDSKTRADARERAARIEVMRVKLR